MAGFGPETPLGVGGLSAFLPERTVSTGRKFTASKKTVTSESLVRACTLATKTQHAVSGTHSRQARRDAKHITVRTLAPVCTQRWLASREAGTVREGRSLPPRSVVGRPRRYAAIDGVYPSVFFSQDLTTESILRLGKNGYMMRGSLESVTMVRLVSARFHWPSLCSHCTSQAVQWPEGVALRDEVITAPSCSPFFCVTCVHHAGGLGGFVNASQSQAAGTPGGGRAKDSQSLMPVTIQMLLEAHERQKNSRRPVVCHVHFCRYSQEFAESANVPRLHGE